MAHAEIGLGTTGVFCISKAVSLWQKELMLLASQFTTKWGSLAAQPLPQSLGRGEEMEPPLVY